MVYFWILSIKSRRAWPWVGFLVFALATSILKVTTFGVWSILAVLLVVLKYPKQGLANNFKWLCWSIPALGIWIWNAYTDSIKHNNPFTRHLTSGAHWVGWLDLQWSERFSQTYWQGIMIQSMVPLVWGMGALLNFIVFGKNKVFWIFIIVYVSGPLLFTTLYYHHSYYNVAVFPLFTLALATWMHDMSVSKHIWLRILVVGSLLYLGYIFPYKYRYYYQYILKQEQNVPYMSLGKSIQEIVPEDEVVLIEYADWAPIIPFYSCRKAIMLKQAWAKQIPEDSLRRFILSHNPKYVVFSMQKPDTNSVLRRLGINVEDAPIFNVTDFPSAYIYKLKF